MHIRTPSQYDQKEMSEFINGHTQTTLIEDDFGPYYYPWEKPGIRQDVRKQYPLNLTEPQHEKLKWIKDKTGRDMKKMIMALVDPFIDRTISELVAKGVK